MTAGAAPAASRPDPRLTRIRGLLFDKDGTLFDFHATWSEVVARTIAALAPSSEAYREMAEEAGFDPVSGRFRAGSAIVAGAAAEVAILWSRHFPGRSAREIETLLNRAAAEVTGPETLVPATPDLPGLLATLSARGYALGVATHDSERGARHQLAAVGIAEAFSFIAGYDSGHGLKPGPGMLHAFAAATELAPQEIAMIGDSRHDLEMVRAAGGGFALGVLTGPATAEELAPHADLVIADIGALPGLFSDPAKTGA